MVAWWIFALDAVRRPGPNTKKRARRNLRNPKADNKGGRDEAPSLKLKSTVHILVRSRSARWALPVGLTWERRRSSKIWGLGRDAFVGRGGQPNRHETKMSSACSFHGRSCVGWGLVCRYGYGLLRVIVACDCFLLRSREKFIPGKGN